MPPRNVVPKPVQKPHPPLWVACSRRDTILLAAEKGIGALSFAFIDPEEAVHWITDYEAKLASECVPVGKAVNANVACVTPMMCARTEEEALARGLEGGNFFGYSLGHYYVFGDHKPGTTDVWKEYVERRAEHGYSPEVAVALEQERLGAKVAAGDTTGLRGATGTPEQIREYCQRFEDVRRRPADLRDAGRQEPARAHLRSRSRCSARRSCRSSRTGTTRSVAAKAKRLEPIIEQAMARKADDAPKLPDDYSMKAIPLQMIEASRQRAGQAVAREVRGGPREGRAGRDPRHPWIGLG